MAKPKPPKQKEVVMQAPQSEKLDVKTDLALNTEIITGAEGTGELDGVNVTEAEIIESLVALAIENLGETDEVVALVREAVKGIPADRIVSNEIPKEDALGKLIEVCTVALAKNAEARLQQQQDLEAIALKELQAKEAAQNEEALRLAANEQAKLAEELRLSELAKQESADLESKLLQEQKALDARADESKFEQVNRFKLALTNVRAGIAINVNTMHQTHVTCFNSLRSIFDMKSPEDSIEALREILAYARSEANGVFHRSRAMRHIGTLSLLSAVNYAEYRTLLSFITDYANRSASMSTTNWDNFMASLNPKTSEKTFRLLSKAAGIEH